MRARAARPAPLAARRRKDRHEKDGRFHTVNDPNTNGTPPVNQLLGVNDGDIAVGFYTDAQGNNHGYTYDIGNQSFAAVTVPGNPGLSLTAAAINDRRDIAGFYTDANGVTHAFLQDRYGQFRLFRPRTASPTGGAVRKRFLVLDWSRGQRPQRSRRTRRPGPPEPL